MAVDHEKEGHSLFSHDVLPCHSEVPLYLNQVLLCLTRVPVYQPPVQGSLNPFPACLNPDLIYLKFVLDNRTGLKWKRVAMSRRAFLRKQEK